MQKETVMATKTESTKLLVICVDRDNDVGEKTGLETPVVGRNACIEAAQIDEKPKMPFLRYSLNNGKMPEFVDSPEGHGYTYIKIIKLMEMHPLVDHSQLQK